MNVSAEARERFLREYAHIRHAEGRGSDANDYYRELPFRDVSGRNSAMWAMRATTYSTFLEKVLAPLEAAREHPLEILDLGAGNCWLSYRLALKEHHPIAVDIFNDERDGLGSAKHYPVQFPVQEADFDELPFEPATFDVAIFNASLHYSTDYFKTLEEVRRCLKGHGLVVVLDSPIYRTHDHGMQMVAEKRQQFLKQYGFASDALPSMEFLDLAMLRRLSEELNIEWQIHKPWYGWRWHLRPLRAALKRQRPPSSFWILVGRFRTQ